MSFPNTPSKAQIPPITETPLASVLKVGPWSLQVSGRSPTPRCLRAKVEGLCRNCSPSVVCTQAGSQDRAGSQPVRVSANRWVSPNSRSLARKRSCKAQGCDRASVLEPGLRSSPTPYSKASSECPILKPESKRAARCRKSALAAYANAELGVWTVPPSLHPRKSSLVSGESGGERRPRLGGLSCRPR